MVNEAEVQWNQRYIDGDTPWDKGTYTPAVLEIFAKQVIPADAEVLVPGCGFGHDARAFADAGYSVTGVDIAVSAVEGAEAMHVGVEGLSFVIADLFDPELPRQKRYGAIWEHTCYCAIRPEQRKSYAEAVYNLLEEGGLFIALFFTNTETPLSEGPPFETSVEEAHAVFSNYFDLVWDKEPADTFPARVGCEQLMVWRRKS